MLVHLHRFPLPLPYSNAMKIQNELIKCNLSESTDHIMILEHSPVITLGRREHGRTEGLHNIPKSIPISNRGGQVTYHGPGQLVIYPILDLRRWKPNLHWYLDNIEKVLRLTCKPFIGEKLISSNGKGEVFIENDRKIGFVGFQNQKWITSHGFSLNISNNLEIYKKFIPCGQKMLKVTSLQAEYTNPVSFSRKEVEERLLEEFEKVFECRLLNK